MRRFIVGFFAIIGALVVLVIVAGIGIAVYGRKAPVRIADNTVLALDIGAGFSDAAPSDGLSQFLFPGRPPLKDVLDALEKAGGDARVKGLIARIGDGEMGLSQAQELRDAIAAFRAKGKRAVAYSDSFGEFSSGTRSYYLASAFDDIWLQPHGLVGLIGLRAEEPFFRGTLDLLGVVPRFDHRSEYKSATDPFTEKTMTAADREQLTALLDSIYGQIVRGIAADRKLDQGAVRALVDRAPLLAQEALDAHLIDHIGYSDEAMAALDVAPGGDKRALPLSRYLDAAGRPHQSGPTIALIYATGAISRSASDEDQLLGNEGHGADAVVRAFRLAERDKAVRAILFRVDSPGGSAVASESIWRETLRAQAAGKKVIVSMGDVAASGGYYIAAAADKIVAEPATLTGSIGVLAGKVLLDGLLEKIGAGASSVEVGANAALFSAFEDFSPAGHQRFEAFLDDVYAGFKDRVASGRKMDAAAVESLAKGRVWSGEDAKAKGLVDATGGFATALALAKEAAGIAADSDVTVKLFPPPENAARQFISRALGREPSDDQVMLERMLAMLQPLVGALERFGPAGALTMAPVELH
ncbi:MAG TPA: signal peptide peptidase SppA [Stellaceae bacterium]|nr:signal peptide peptidase SppA [Stellaceae bacterium]